jgi:MFS family permease
MSNPIRQTTFIIFLSTYMFANLLSAVAVSSNMFIIGRAVQGLGGAGVMNGVFTIIAASVPRDKKPSEYCLTGGLYLYSVLTSKCCSVYLGVGIGISSIGQCYCIIVDSFQTNVIV